MDKNCIHEARSGSLYLAVNRLVSLINTFSVLISLDPRCRMSGNRSFSFTIITFIISKSEFWVVKWRRGLMDQNENRILPHSFFFFLVVSFCQYCTSNSILLVQYRSYPLLFSIFFLLWFHQAPVKVIRDVWRWHALKISRGKEKRGRRMEATTTHDICMCQTNNLGTN